MRYYAEILQGDGQEGMRPLNYLAAAALLPGATILGAPATWPP